MENFHMDTNNEQKKVFLNPLKTSQFYSLSMAF